MHAAVIEAPGSVVVRDIPDPYPAPGEVVIAVGGCGICGTDLHLVEGSLPNTSYPLTPGHEFYGKVVEVNLPEDRPEVGALCVGTWVAVDPNLPCGTCLPCLAGRSNLCDNYAAIGVTRAGACAEYVAAPASVCAPLPPDFPLEVASLIEPMSCVIHGLDRVGDRPRDGRWLVYGAGTVGLLMANAAQALTNNRVCVVETNADRRERAASFGFRTAASAEELDGPDWDTVVDCTGSTGAIKDGLNRVATGGTVLLFGVAAPGATVDLEPYAVYRREITIVGSMAVMNSFDRAVTALAAKPEFAAGLVTHRFELTDYVAALDTFRSGESGKVEIVTA
ncbi:MAG TPA: alcohol dehydrogenase catalytic domain-containing protein [Mycobacteriales bacterium]|nr:alcohol dehydrogenase catalytic domain-containing protein [Mycobacteriales bacterium]